MRNIGVSMYRLYTEDGSKPFYLLDEAKAYRDAFSFLRKCDKSLQIDSDFLAYYATCKDDSLLDYSAVYYTQFIFTLLDEDSISAIKESINLFVKSDKYAPKEGENCREEPYKFIFPSEDNDSEIIEGIYGSVLVYTIYDFEKHLRKTQNKAINFTKFIPKKRLNRSKKLNKNYI